MDLLKRMDLEPGVHDVETHVFNVSVYPTYQSWSRPMANSKGVSYDDAVDAAIKTPLTSRHQVVEVLVLRRTLLEYTAAVVEARDDGEQPTQLVLEGYGAYHDDEEP